MPRLGGEHTQPTEELVLSLDALGAPDLNAQTQATSTPPADVESVPEPVKTIIEPQPEPEVTIDELDIDEQLVEIFREEAQEIVASIKTNHTKWGENVDDQSAIAELRRSFHTLKGSARMIGASTLGELGWSGEKHIDLRLEGNNTTIAVKESLNVTKAIVDHVDEHFDTLISKPAALPTTHELIQKVDALTDGEVQVFEWGEADEGSVTATLSDEAHVQIESIESAVSEQPVMAQNQSSIADDSVEIPYEQTLTFETSDVADEVIEPSTQLNHEYIVQNKETSDLALESEPVEQLTAEVEIENEVSSELVQSPSSLPELELSSITADEKESAIFDDAPAEPEELSSITADEKESAIFDDVPAEPETSKRAVFDDGSLELEHEIAVQEASVADPEDAFNAFLDSVGTDDGEETIDAPVEDDQANQLAATFDNVPEKTEEYTDTHTLNLDIGGFDVDELASVPMTIEEPEITAPKSEPLELQIQSHTDTGLDGALEKSPISLSLDDSLKESDGSSKQSYTDVSLDDLPNESHADLSLDDIHNDTHADLSLDDVQTEFHADLTLDDVPSKSHTNMSLDEQSEDSGLSMVAGGLALAGVAAAGSLLTSKADDPEQDKTGDFPELQLSTNEDPVEKAPEVSEAELLLENIEATVDPELALSLSTEDKVSMLDDLSLELDIQHQEESVLEPKVELDPEVEPEPEPKVEPEEPAQVDEAFVAIYLEELSELLESFEGVIERLHQSPDDQSLIHETERVLHTIKGGARMTGLTGIADISHVTESVLNRFNTQQHDIDEYTLEKLQEVSDELISMSEAVAMDGKDFSSSNVIDDLNQLLEQMGGEKYIPKAKAKPEEKPSEAQEQKEQVVDAESSTDFDIATANYSGQSRLAELLSERASNLPDISVLGGSKDAGDKKDDDAKESTVRISSALINSLIDKMGEWGVQSSRLTEDLEGTEKNVDELKRTTVRLREQIRRLSLETDSRIKHSNHVPEATKKSENFDALEMDEYSEMQQLSRALSETVEDMASLTDVIEQMFKDVTKSSQGQERTGREIQQGLISTRMTRLSGILPRLKRIARQTSSELGKQVMLEVDNADSEIDRTILQRVIASLEHLLRNSISHGIETPEQRIAAGKPAVGSIFVDFNRDGAEVVITLRDDGRGLDTEQIRQKAIQKGLIKESDQLKDEEIHRLILSSGLSTSDNVTQISGRGVGMDVVNAELHALGGGIDIASKQNEYTKFTLRLPYTLATNQVLMITVGQELLAVPVNQVIGLHRMQQEALEQCYQMDKPEISYMSKPCQLVNLREMLGIAPADDNESEVKPLLILAKDDERVAFQVDDLQSSREIMLKPLGPLFNEAKLISAATILGGGRIVMILDSQEMVSMAQSGNKLGLMEEEDAHAKSAQVVMVVDDSITVRKVSAKILESIGYEVITATDGVNALEVLETHTPDIVLLDIEMPHMDGFELLTRLRSSSAWKQLPVIMISSRTGQKHREQAESLGANQFIGKPWHQEQLKNEITQLLGSYQ